MSKPEELFQKLDPRRFIGSGGVSGHVPVARLQRLSETLDSDDGEVEFELYFYDSRGLFSVEGRVDALLRLTCQRCLSVYELPVSRSVKLALVSGPEEAARVDGDFDPYLLDEGTVVPGDLIEDELLLAIPDVPRHPEGVCEPPVHAGGEAPMSDARAESGLRENPFSVLDRMRKR